MKKQTFAEMARSAGVTKEYFNNVKSGVQKTANVDCAIAVAQVLGGRPIDFISKGARRTALQLNPKLNQRVKKILPKDRCVVKR